MSLKSGLIYTIAAAALLLTSGCATKGSVNTLNNDVQTLQSEWAAFERGYDPAMRTELEENLQELRAVNADIALLRDDVARKANRVTLLLGQIDNNELDKAIGVCHQYATDADYFAATAQRHADAALSAFEETRMRTRFAMQRHVDKHHRVDEQALIAKIEKLERRLAKLQRKMERQERDNHPGKGEGRK
jgi:outer membrane murein-binding lipoprotein Lpp